MERKLFNRWHYGWAMIIGSFVFLAFAWGIIFNVSALLFVPIETDLGFTRRHTMNAVTMRGLGFILGALLAGRLFSKFRVLPVARIASVCAAFSYAAMGFMRAPWQYALLFFLQCVTMCVCGMIPISILLRQWFRSNVGTALGLGLMGSAAGGIVFNPLAGRLLTQFGWRITVWIFAAAILAVGYFVWFRLLVYRPADIGLQPVGEAGEAPVIEIHTVEPSPEETSGSLFSHRPFWLIAFGIVSMNAGLAMLLNNTAAYLTGQHFEVSVVATVSGLIMLSMTLGKVIFGYLFDRIGIRLTTVLTALCLLIGVSALLMPHIPGSIWMSAIGTGLGSAFNTLAPPIFAESLYGIRDFTRINALFQSVGGAGMMIAPLLVSILYADESSYRMIFILFASWIAVTTVLWIFLLPHRVRTRKVRGRRTL